VRAVIMQEGVQEANLAWALARAAKPALDSVDRNDIFATIGAGETFEAICRLLKFVAANHIPVKSDLVFGCRSWLRGYTGHQHEPYLRCHIEDLVVAYFVQGPQTEPVNHRPAAPRAKNAAAISSMAAISVNSVVGRRPSLTAASAVPRHEL
jgi:hypothetical protein